MSQRRFFLKKSFGGACALLLSSGLIGPFSKKWAELLGESSSTDTENQYKVKFIYAFESEPARTSLLPKIENVSFIEAVNQKYTQTGQILSFVHDQHDKFVSNLYFFNSERSYLEWESEMVSAHVMDPKYCSKTISRRDDLSYLSAQGHGLNKLVIVEVNSPKIA